MKGAKLRGPEPGPEAQPPACGVHSISVDERRRSTKWSRRDEGRRSKCRPNGGEPKNLAVPGNSEIVALAYLFIGFAILYTVCRVGAAWSHCLMLADKASDPFFPWLNLVKNGFQTEKTMVLMVWFGFGNSIQDCNGVFSRLIFIFYSFFLC